ncbi:Putative Holin-X, holin superfamily III [Rubritalea squalenifaciens DSM 18772]|uniref:Putative Holin-X, holin superfamily III n=1 Tax=Rubritalea squalenifaciens DSM 18772 TaxID=1123071 RepID=A0A1M6MFI9_9BACT|nr:phage holin family protein [Rubritalea squalenifaciens]SHJ82090.1 Putative Holin-X, holin superfamily III [Rubritalea squalenifaciens DSM 18772]
MQEPETQNKQDTISIKDTVMFLKDSGVDYLKVKAELASLEAKEAAQYGVRKATIGAIGAFFGFIAYLLLLATVIGAGSHYLEGKVPQAEKYIGTWPLVALALLIIHALVAFICLDKLKRKTNQEFFTLTKAEIEKDKLWLQEMKSNSES